jgi:thiamine-monophosphate kinase
LVIIAGRRYKFVVPDESKIISWVRSRARPGHGLVIGIGDDAAVWRPTPGLDLLVCCDLSVEDIHFRSEWATPRQIGHKCLAVTISDIAAIGGTPRYALVSAALPSGKPEGFFEQLFEGIFDLADKLDVRIIGGDTSRSPGPIFLDSMVVGECASGRAVPRSGSRPGDLIFVTGSLGASALGLYFLQTESSLLQTASRALETPVASAPHAPANRPGNHPNQGATDVPAGLPSNGPNVGQSPSALVELGRARLQSVERHLTPEPRVAAGKAIGTSGLATAMIDISDGLSTDLNHIITESGHGALLYTESIPIAKSVVLAKRAGAAIDPLSLALHGGEEYELLFTGRPVDRPRVEELLKSVGLHVSCIGEVVADPGLKLSTDGVRSDLIPSGFEHSI